MASPNVSVVIPAYNAAWCLAETVRSVREQTRQDLEVILIDDGSTDNTWPLMQELAADWPKVRPLHFENGGTPAAINRGLNAARGEWLAVLGADDIWLPDLLERCLGFFAEHPELSIVYSPMKPIHTDGRPMRGHSKPCHAGRLTDRLFHSIFIHDSSTVFHRRVFQACGGFDETLRVGSGHEFWLRVSTKFGFGLIDEPLALRRWHEESLTRSKRSRSRRFKAGMLERFYFEQGGKDLLRPGPALRRLGRVHYACGTALIREGHFAEAKGYLRKAIRYCPASPRPYAVYPVACVGGLFERNGK
ncbi:MAG TPA: glycosyltransferase [Phycisphaerae bacterium]|nr:glycosyltransferase [Phycisphaerae bacterium]